jgi:hypothetical protein
MKSIVVPKLIEQKIFLIRGQKVMISSHLAVLYGVKTSALIQAVKRNRARFPGDFMFELKREEILNLSQFVISSKIKHSPSIQAFTEHGILMLSSVLRSERAVQVNIQIMRAYVKLRQILATHKDLAQKFEELEKKVSAHDSEIKNIFAAIRQLMTPVEKPKPKIGFMAE